MAGHLKFKIAKEQELAVLAISKQSAEFTKTKSKDLLNDLIYLKNPVFYYKTINEFYLFVKKG
jgi:hypothetical protein